MNFTGATGECLPRYWDSAILEAARAAGCKKVMSEDMQDGQDFAGVKVVNPFK